MAQMKNQNLWKRAGYSAESVESSMSGCLN